jgi:pyruvate formate lyase activating enzyme
VEEAARYVPFVAASGGGFTVSGGEPLLQPAFTAALLAGARALGLHTALDTSGFLGGRASDAMLDDADLVLLDIKSWHPATYRRLTGRGLAPTLDFARRLAARGTPTWVRFVVAPGWTDDEANVAGVAEFTASLGNVERVDVLPFHSMGAAKWARLGLRYQLGDVRPPSDALVARVEAQLRSHGLPVV